ncbi:MAG: xanthine dehydrogenase small subunit [Alphaproteobacteria bacterium]|nr:xanthine dehydrogenase small subunit [Alphaproteobacteria bacterium]
MAALRFLLNGQRVVEDSASPTMTVLDYLRGVRRLTGAKEGCAEGDCGACTIAVAWPHGGARYRAVNSCLMLLPQIDGAAVLTVEGLAAPDGALHPVQQALVETDGTQCGFCTPGFVMAMLAFRQGGETADDAAIHDALAGNLCRCTGYRPIVDACKRAAAAPDPLAARAAEDLARLSDVPPGIGYTRHGRSFYAPRSIDDLHQLLRQNPEAPLLGGGTDLGLLASKERRGPPVVISTQSVPELKRILRGPDVQTFGGAVTYAEALPCLDSDFPSFAALVRRIGSRQIRNLGTLAGNIATASPIGDTLPCLIALGASVVLRSAEGTRRLEVESFITGYRKTDLRPGEFIDAIEIPRLGNGQRFVAYKLSKRFDQDISAVIAAFRLELDRGRLAEFRAAFGGMAATPRRASALEAALTGRMWRRESLVDVDALVARDFQPIDDVRATAAYRLRAAANLVRRLQLETGAGPAPAGLDAL